MGNQQYNYTTIIQQATNKLEHYCAYQDRCHSEVTDKLFKLKVPIDIHDQIVVHLIEQNFLNEQRFAQSFARGKHRISGWGKQRITAELKQRKISPYLIKKALEEITDEMYFETLNKISLSRWNTLSDIDIEKKKFKLKSYLYRKGYEYEFINDQLDFLSEQQDTFR